MINTLDLLLCNSPAYNLLLNHNVTSAPWMTDNFLISSEIRARDFQKKNKNINLLPNFKIADYEKINQVLTKVNWNFLSLSTDFQLMYNRFCDMLTSIIDEHIPKMCQNPKKDKRPPQYLRQLLKQKRTLYDKSKLDHALKVSYRKTSEEYDDAVNK